MRWVLANDFNKELSKQGWHTPDTYNNCFSFAPSKPAVYLFTFYQADKRNGLIDFERLFVAYVGMSKNVKLRWQGHSILNQVRDRADYVQRWFLPIPVESLRIVEANLIQQFNPPWNIQGRKRGVFIDG